MKNIVKNCREYSALTIMVCYMIVYLITFYELENRTVGCYIISFGIDAYIPFCEIFIIPYLLWFAYVALSVITLGLFDKEECARLVTFLIAGMTIFLFISVIFPNGHHLRPRSFARDNIFVDLVKNLYLVDTSTNVVPSIHVYNSIGIMISSCRTKLLKNKPVIKAGMLLLGFSIICSTVFIKQHSMLDVLTACILSAALYSVSFKSEFVKSSSTAQVK